MQGSSKRHDLDSLRAFAAALGADPEAAIVDNGGPPALIGPKGRISVVHKGRIHPPSDGFLIDCRAASGRRLRRFCQTWAAGMFLDRLPTANEAELIAMAIGLVEAPKRARGRPRKTPREAPTRVPDLALVVVRGRRRRAAPDAPIALGTAARRLFRS